MQGQLGVDPQDPVVGGDHRGPGDGDVLRQSRGRNRDVLLRTVEGTGCAPVRAGLGIGMC